MYIREKHKKYSGVIKLLWSPDWGELAPGVPYTA